MLGPGGFPVEGPPPISAIPKEGELRHNGQASAHVEQRVIHSHLVVIKNTKLHDLTGEFHGVLIGINTNYFVTILFPGVHRIPTPHNHQGDR